MKQGFFKIAVSVVGTLTSFAIYAPAHADVQTAMVRVLCMPEEGLAHFSVHQQMFKALHNYLEPYRSGGLEVLKQYGFLNARKYSFMCKLPEHTYTIFGYRPLPRERGMCGGAPRTVISLKRDTSLVIDEVFLDRSCFTDLFKDRSLPFVKAISRENFSGWPDRIILRLSNGLDEQDLSIDASRTFDQHDLDCLQEKGFFIPETRSQAKEACLDSSTNRQPEGD